MGRGALRNLERSWLIPDTVPQKVDFIMGLQRLLHPQQLTLNPVIARNWMTAAWQSLADSSLHPRRPQALQYRYPQTDFGLPKLVGRPASVSTHVVAFTDLNATVAQDGVGGGHVEEKLWQAVVQQIGAGNQLLFFGGAGAQYDFAALT